MGWPIINERTVNKYYPETTETPKGHLNQSRKNVRSTKDKTAGKRRIISTAAKAISQAKNNKQNISETSESANDFETPNTAELKGKKVRDVYTKVYDVRETVFSDQTGHFLLVLLGITNIQDPIMGPTKYLIATYAGPQYIH